MMLNRHPPKASDPGAVSRISPPASIYLITGLSALGGLLFGFDTGVISEAQLFLIKTFAFIFCYTLAPETKGRTLEQVAHYWQNGHHWDKAA